MAGLPAVLRHRGWTPARSLAGMRGCSAASLGLWDQKVTREPAVLRLRLKAWVFRQNTERRSLFQSQRAQPFGPTTGVAGRMRPAQWWDTREQCRRLEMLKMELGEGDGSRSRRLSHSSPPESLEMKPWHRINRPQWDVRAQRGSPGRIPVARLPADPAPRPPAGTGTGTGTGFPRLLALPQPRSRRKSRVWWQDQLTTQPWHPQSV